jgi:hypothetical protein
MVEEAYLHASFAVVHTPLGMMLPSSWAGEGASSSVEEEPYRPSSSVKAASSSVGATSFEEVTSSSVEVTSSSVEATSSSEA